MRLPLLVLMLMLVLVLVLVLARFVKGNGKVQRCREVQPAAVRGKEGRWSAGVGWGSGPSVMVKSQDSTASMRAGVGTTLQSCLSCSGAYTACTLSISLSCTPSFLLLSCTTPAVVCASDKSRTATNSNDDKRYSRVGSVGAGV
jgi:hypothetical protein